MAREMTEAEQAAMRSDGQASKIYAAILKPETVFSCRVNQTFASSDKVAGFNFDGGSGDYEAVLPGMTVYVGTSAGARDRGIARVRKAWGEAVAYIGETSEIEWANDLYITVVDDFRIWRRDIYPLDDDTYLVDHEIAYSAQHNVFAPVVCMGSHAVAWLVEGQAEISFDASGSWCLSSGSKTYQWSASAGDFDNASAVAPVLTVDEYVPYVQVGCSVTVNDVTSTGYRYVFLFDDDHPPYQVKPGAIGGDYDNGGWNFDLTFYDDISDLPPNPLVVLFARDWYQGVEQSIGPLAGRENVIAWGWGGPQDVADRAQYGQVEISVYGPHWWMDGLTYPVGVELFDTTATPAGWKEMQGLTVDKALFHLLHWRSTATCVMDIFLSGDTRQASSLTAQAGTLWEQIKDIAAKKIFAWPCCNRYGQMYIQVDAQMLDAGGRAVIPVVMTLQKQDWSGELEITRRIPRAAYVALSTLQHADGNTTVRYSLAPGHIPAGSGFTRLADGYLAGSQAQSNALCGLMATSENAAYDFRIQAAANNRLVDICPRQYLALSIAASDTPRGIAYDGNAIVREVSLTLEESGFLSASWEAEAASETVAGIDGDIPTEDGFDPMPPGKDFGGIPVPQLPPDLGGWDGNTQIDNAPPYAVLMLGWNSPRKGLWYTKNFNFIDPAPTWQAMNFGLTLDDLDDLNWFASNRAGRLYIASSTTIWSALIGQPWKKVFTAPVGERVFVVSCNPLMADSIMAIVGKNYPGEYNYTYVGSSAGIGQRSLLTQPAAFESGSLTYGADAWLWTHTRGVLSTGTIHRITPSGDEAYVNTIDSFGGQDHFHFRAGTADYIIHAIGNKAYTDGGEVGIELGSPELAQMRPQIAALSPDGTRVMGIDIEDRLRKSSDGGLNWSLVPIDTIGAFQQFCAVDAADAERFAIAASSLAGIPPLRIYYTPDFGETWTDKTGNLVEVAGIDSLPWNLKMIG